jgi:spermidine/putrescine ABC transporter ATP-binding subunit
LEKTVIDNHEIVIESAKESATTPANIAVEVRNVSKSFGTNTAVHDITLLINKGEFFSFLGPSGCGKTTLLRMIAGFENPTQGSISIAGADMQGVPPHKRPVNMVFQNYALFPHLTIAENVAFGLKSKGNLSATEISKRVTDALELVRLGSFSERLPSQISGGQQQRAALARAVVNNPSVLLLDEPLSALDPQIREEMQFELARLQKNLGMTFIMVTHDQNEALALSSRIAVFRQGRLEQIASPEEIYRSPKTVFVAKFIGQTNVLEGTVSGFADQLEFLSTAPRAHYEVGSKVAVLIKPHAIYFVNSEKQNDNSDNVFDAQILNRSFQGTSTEYLVNIESKIELRMFRTNTSFSASEKFELDQNVRICIPPQACELLSL